MIRYTKCTFYFAGATEAQALTWCKRFLDAFEGWTLQAAKGGWKCAVEASWVLTIVLPTDTPSRIVFPQGEGAPGRNAALMPAEENTVDIEARNIAENLALEFKQDAVAYDLAPVAFALTTGQARYHRNG